MPVTADKGPSADAAGFNPGPEAGGGKHTNPDAHLRSTVLVGTKGMAKSFCHHGRNPRDDMRGAVCRRCRFPTDLDDAEKMWRTLAYEDPRQGRTRIGHDDIAAFSQPVVILGDPGLGKSVLTEAFGEMSGMNYVLAGTLTRSAEPESLIIYGRANHRRRARRDRLRSARQRGRSRVEATFGNGQSTL